MDFSPELEMTYVTFFSKIDISRLKYFNKERSGGIDISKKMKKVVLNNEKNKECQNRCANKDCEISLKEGPFDQRVNYLHPPSADSVICLFLMTGLEDSCNHCSLKCDPSFAS